MPKRKRPIEKLDPQDQATIARICGANWRNLTLIETVEMLCDFIQTNEVDK